MNLEGVLAVAGAIVSVAAIYVIVTGPHTSAVIRSAGDAFSASIRAATGQG